MVELVDKGGDLLIRLAEIKSGALGLRSLCFSKEPSLHSSNSFFKPNDFAE